MGSSSISEVYQISPTGFGLTSKSSIVVGLSQSVHPDQYPGLTDVSRFPSRLKLHLVMDNYGTHKEPHVQRWLRKQPRFVCHFVPTSSSWLNLVERWFRELTDKAIRRGSFVSVPDLKRAMDEFLTAWNDAPEPFIWTVTVEEMIEKIGRARAKMERLKPGSTLPRGKKREL